MDNRTNSPSIFPGNFDDGLDAYLDLWDKGLKKQANQYLQKFLDTWEATTEPSVRNDILENFCDAYFDHEGYTRLKERQYRALPYALSKLVWQFLRAKCDMHCMPHMRWIWQLYGRRYNPFDPQYTYDLYSILEQAYTHEKCDQKTVDLYFQERLGWLDWGAHHFPDCCLITKQAYLDTVHSAQEIMKNHAVNEALLDLFHDQCKLYECYYQYEAEGKKRDFDEICEQAGLAFSHPKTYPFAFH